MYKVVLGVMGFEVWRGVEYIYTFRKCESAERYVKAQNKRLYGAASSAGKEKNKHSGKC